MHTSRLLTDYMDLVDMKMRGTGDLLMWIIVTEADGLSD